MQNADNILHSFNNGDHKTMKIVFDSNFDFACAMAYKMVKDKLVAEDITIECFVKLFERHKEIDNIRGYLLVSVRNAAINHIIAYNRQNKRLREYTATLEIATTESIDETEILNEIYKCAELMPFNYAQAFRLVHFAGKKPAEIAKILNKKPHTIQVHYCRAIAWIRKHVKIKQKYMKINKICLTLIIVLSIATNTSRAQVEQCKQVSYSKLEISDTVKVIRYTGEGTVCYTYTHYQIPLTPFYVLQPNKWFKHRHAPIVRLGWWYVPFISRR